MYSTMTSTEFEQAIREQEIAAKDYVAATSHLRVTTENGDTTLHVTLPDEIKTFATTPLFHKQTATDLRIPYDYYARMREQLPMLYDMSVNNWLQWQSKPENNGGKRPRSRFIRTLNYPGQPSLARANLSDSYLVMDPYALMEEVAGPVLAGLPGITVVSCNLTPERMDLKVVSERLAGEVKIGDIVQLGAHISTSPVGLGKYQFDPLIFRLSCLNGMVTNVANEYGIQRIHRGRALGDGDGREYLTPDTLKKEMDAFYAGCRDILKGVFTDLTMARLLGKMKDATTRDIIDPGNAVQVITSQYKLSAEVSETVYRHLTGDGEGMSQWGLINAVTATAREVKSYDTANELERLGGHLLDLTPSQWREIAVRQS